VGLDGDAMTIEYADTTLQDARLNERLRRIVSLAAVEPADSFPEQMASVADREALYRFLANPKVTLAGVLSGHVRQTQARLQAHRVVRLVHDTTTFRFLGDRTGLGVTRGGAKGFLAHVALALAADDTREPLGVLSAHPYIHQDAIAHRGLTPSQRVEATRAKPRAAKESARWERMALDVAAVLPDTVQAVHVMDQEADDYDVLAALHDAQLRYVIRADPRRQTMETQETVGDIMGRQPATVFRTVPLTPRSTQKAGRTRGRHPARLERDATLHIRWGIITLGRRQYSHSSRQRLSLRAVHVFESEPPPGEAPIEWMLLTSERVETLADAIAIVDHYRARWIIEEYFKALKTGCAFEKRQLTTFDGLVRALAIFIPMAWRLLVLRHLGRTAPSRTAHHTCLEPEQLVLLRKLLDRRRYAFSAQPTTRDIMLGIAALGGHIVNNGDPGWLVLGRGLTRLLDADLGWRLAREEM